MKKLLTAILIAAVLAAPAGCTPAENATTIQDTQPDSASAGNATTMQDTQSDSAPAGNETVAKQEAAVIEDGEYQAQFTTDSSMFKVNEAYGDMGTLTVKDGKMTIHISLPSENIVHLFPGVSEDAKKEGAKLLEPTKDEVTYSDGMTETVNGFDVPVPYLDKEFDLALIGTKGKWYDHKVVVSLSEAEEEPASIRQDSEAESEESFWVDILFEGGTGKACIQSPVEIIEHDGKMAARFIWSSKNYDYMIVDGVKYENENSGEESTFTVPIERITGTLPVIGDTVAMSEPHEIEYQITWGEKTEKKKKIN